MQILTKSQQVKKVAWQLLMDKFDGVATVLDDYLLGKKYAKIALNLFQVQDGRWKNRWGRDYWGQALPGETGIIGGGVYNKDETTRELIVIGETTGKAYKSVDGGAWTEITGAVFDVSAKDLFFKQINNYYFICNGVDRLTRYNGTVLTRYTPLSAPTGLGFTRGGGLSAGSYHNYYKVTALNDIGETVASSEIDATTNKLRDAWNLASNEYVDLTWTVVSGAIKYQIYYSDVSGKEEFLAEASTNSFRDDNSYTPNIYVVAPDADTTGAPKFSMIATSGSRIWGIAPKEFPYRVFVSGTGQYLGIFAYSFGGGWIDLDFGSEETVAYIEHYRTGKGDTAATVFTKSPKNTGSVWQVQFIIQTIAEESILVLYPEKIVGSVGTNAPGSALLVGDSIMFLSGRGIYSLSNKENVTNVLSTTAKSQNIRPSYLALNFARSEQFRAYPYQNFIFFSATSGTGENDLVFLYDTDLDRFYWYWDFGVRQFIEYTDSAGKTKFLLIPTSGNQLVECNENISGDFGQPIKTSLISGLIPIDADQRLFAKVLEVLIVLSRPKGTINLEILGIEKKKGFSSLATKAITSNLQTIEFWTGDLGEITLMDEEDVSKTYTQASVKKRKKIGKSLNAIQFHIYSDTADTEYTLISLQADGFIDPTKPPTTWN